VELSISPFISRLFKNIKIGVDVVIGGGFIEGDFLSILK
jgi:hypothetical protein